MPPAPSRADAEAGDRADELAPFRHRFVLDDAADAPIYVDGNSLGRLPRSTADRLREVVEASRLGLGGGVVDDFAGGALVEASPIERAPLGVPVLLVHGTEDEDVPASLSERFAARGGDVTVKLREGEGHMEHIDPTSGAWEEVVAWLTT